MALTNPNGIAPPMVVKAVDGIASNMAQSRAGQTGEATQHWWPVVLVEVGIVELQKSLCETASAKHHCLFTNHHLI